MASHKLPESKESLERRLANYQETILTCDDGDCEAIQQQIDRIVALLTSGAMKPEP